MDCISHGDYGMLRITVLLTGSLDWILVFGQLLILRIIDEEYTRTQRPVWLFLHLAIPTGVPA